ncbi:CRISPR-associated endonuclease Cas1 [Acidithiobacillus caldus]|uniref:CRISPR-associated endonuclease Cas1 n=1 Tax=Acidithiobacillus caldus TaxID=33059 RepID=A0A1E7YKF7_9PROT|nr:CRISPR-associated endonuclease Cas1 [Acidithiobacillus caldus]OFC30308.1 CRISPR-associated endonuclease Cas1 [Acidithiobacillus caldus]OFC37599.1 CRISPR-associated endonuclease Cas1 [Acidithiobacillus caldus]OFC39186.1 CRISPR-associated endonuclease Cas1 [Acidithiobacillus caldus]
MGPLLAEAFSDSTLLNAWHRVKENDGVAGVDGESIAGFSKNLLQNISQLQQQTMDGSYRPSPLLRVWMDRPGKSPRGLAIPTVRDRILQTAVALVIGPILDQHFEACSFAYRPAHSIQMALAAVLDHRDAGFRWVVDADIYQFFDEIAHLRLLRKVKEALPDYELVQWIARWMRAPIQDQHSLSIPRKGIAQGSPLSPLLANLYLDELDERLLENGYRVVRYADDFIVLCKDRGEAERALHLSEDVLHLLQLRIQPDKTHVTNFQEGFSFLGVNFLNDAAESDTVDLRSLLERSPIGSDRKEGDTYTSSKPLAVASPQQVSTGYRTTQHESGPLEHTLYITEQGAYLTLRNERIIIRHDGAENHSLPLHRVTQIVLQGNQLVSTALLRSCRENQTDVFLSSFTGACELRMDDLEGGGLDTWTAQVRAQEDEALLLQVAKAIIQAKLTNSRYVLRNANRHRENAEIDNVIQQLNAHRERITSCKTLDVLRGIEGIAARVYYQGIGQILQPRWHWGGRNRRPPKDPINALLSYGYGLLYQNVLGTLRRAGLNPYLGVYHQLRPGHPALASDLMEEFRALVVDRMVIKLLTDPKTTEADFVLDVHGGLPCKLGTDLRKRCIQSFEERINSTFQHPVSGVQMDFRRAMLAQARHFARVMRREETCYQPFVFR